MKSKVILIYCVLLCWCKIVESIPFPEEPIRQETYQPAIENVQGFYNNDLSGNQDNNVPINGGFPSEESQNYYDKLISQGHNFESLGYFDNPSVLPTNVQGNVDSNIYDNIRNRQALAQVSEDYHQNPQVSFNNQQYRTQNWHTQNQYLNSVSNGVVIPKYNEPSVAPVSYRGQLPTFNYLPPQTRQNYQENRAHPVNQQYMYPLNNADGSYTTNHGPAFTSGYVPIQNSGIPIGNSNRFADYKHQANIQNNDYRTNYGLPSDEFSQGPVQKQEGINNYKNPNRRFDNFNFNNVGSNSNPVSYDNTNPENNVYHQILTGGHRYNFKDVLRHPQIQKLSSNNKRRYIMVYPNGTVEYMNDLKPLDNNVNYRFVTINGNLRDAPNFDTKSIFKIPTNDRKPTESDGVRKLVPESVVAANGKLATPNNKNLSPVITSSILPEKNVQLSIPAFDNKTNLNQPISTASNVTATIPNNPNSQRINIVSSSVNDNDPVGNPINNTKTATVELKKPTRIITDSKTPFRETEIKINVTNSKNPNQNTGAVNVFVNNKPVLNRNGTKTPDRDTGIIKAIQNNNPALNVADIKIPTREIKAKFNKTAPFVGINVGRPLSKTNATNVLFNIPTLSLATPSGTPNKTINIPAVNLPDVITPFRDIQGAKSIINNKPPSNVINTTTSDQDTEDIKVFKNNKLFNITDTEIPVQGRRLIKDLINAPSFNVTDVNIPAIDAEAIIKNIMNNTPTFNVTNSSGTVPVVINNKPALNATDNKTPDQITEAVKVVYNITPELNNKNRKILKQQDTEDVKVFINNKPVLNFTDTKNPDQMTGAVNIVTNTPALNVSDVKTPDQNTVAVKVIMNNEPAINITDANIARPNFKTSKVINRPVVNVETGIRIPSKFTKKQKVVLNKPITNVEVKETTEQNKTVNNTNQDISRRKIIEPKLKKSNPDKLKNQPGIVLAENMAEKILPDVQNKIKNTQIKDKDNKILDLDKTNSTIAISQSSVRKIKQKKDNTNNNRGQNAKGSFAIAKAHTKRNKNHKKKKSSHRHKKNKSTTTTPSSLSIIHVSSGTFKNNNKVQPRSQTKVQNEGSIVKDSKNAAPNGLVIKRKAPNNEINEAAAIIIGDNSEKKSNNSSTTTEPSRLAVEVVASVSGNGKINSGKATISSTKDAERQKPKDDTKTNPTKDGIAKNTTDPIGAGKPDIQTTTAGSVTTKTRSVKNYKFPDKIDDVDLNLSFDTSGNNGTDILTITIEAGDNKDLSNLKENPKVWFSTPNQEKIDLDNMMSCNDTECKLYLFQMPPQPLVQREKIKTIYPNNTVLIETIETTWDSSEYPTVSRTSKLVSLEDLEDE